MQNFDLAYGSVIGSEHVRLNHNNQDSLVAIRGENFCLGVVSDGCGSCPRSEVGSAIMTRIVAKWIPYAFSNFGTTTNVHIDEIPARMLGAKAAIVNSIRKIATESSEVFLKPSLGWDIAGQEQGLLSFDGIIHSCLLATIVGFYICDDYVVVFSIGDGFYAVNGKLVQLDTSDIENNAPAYLAYELFPNIPEKVKDHLDFVVKVFPSKEVDRIMVGTDGVRFLLDADEKLIPGKTRKVGNVSQLWDDRMFVNPDMMHRTMSLLNRDVSVPDFIGQSMITHSSIIKDDIAVVSARRKI
jgi:hypothetical protein